MADLYNWLDAAPAFENAEKAFNKLGDKRNALLGHLGMIRAHGEQRNLPQTAAWLEHQLTSNPLLTTDKELRLFCLIVKGDFDQEIDVRRGRLDWEEVRALAGELGNDRWQNRALAQIGIAAFYDRDLATASQNVAKALKKAIESHDIGAQIRFTTVLGRALLEAKMSERALQYFDNALEIAKQAPDSGYPLFTQLAKLQALVALKRYDASQDLADEITKELKSTNRSNRLAEVLSLEAQIALAKGEVATAISQLQQSISISKSGGFQRSEPELETSLSEIYRQQGDLVRAEHYALQAAESSQSAGDKWSLPQRLQTLAELQVAEGKYAEADKTYDRASAFIDAGLANSSTVLEKTALIKASGNLYPEHFDLVVRHLHNSARAYSIIEKIRGRISADLLSSGARDSPNAAAIEHSISEFQIQMMSAKTVPELNRLRNQIFTAEESRWVTPGISILKTHTQTVIPMNQVQQSLDSRTAILEYVVGEPRSYCLVMTRRGVRVIPLAAESTINRLVPPTLRQSRINSRLAKNRVSFSILCCGQFSKLSCTKT